MALSCKDEARPEPRPLLRAFVDGLDAQWYEQAWAIGRTEMEDVMRGDDWLLWLLCIIQLQDSNRIHATRFVAWLHPSNKSKAPSL